MQTERSWTWRNCAITRSIQFIGKAGTKPVSLLSALGLTRNDAQWLCDELLRAARELDCSLGPLTPHGQRYIQVFDLARGEKTCRIRSVWNIRPNEDSPRLITCFVI